MALSFLGNFGHRLRFACDLTVKRLGLDGFVAEQPIGIVLPNSCLEHIVDLSRSHGSLARASVTDDLAVRTALFASPSADPQVGSRSAVS